MLPATSWSPYARTFNKYFCQARILYVNLKWDGAPLTKLEAIEEHRLWVPGRKESHCCRYTQRVTSQANVCAYACVYTCACVYVFLMSSRIKIWPSHVTHFNLMGFSSTQLMDRWFELDFDRLGESNQGRVLSCKHACVGVRECVCACLCCFIKPILGNRYVRSRGFIVSEPRETHPRSEIADVPTSPCPPLDNLGCPDPHPPP